MNKEFNDYMRAKHNAWQFAYKAYQDYLLSRLGLLNGLVSALESATQCAEKLLKSYLCFKNDYFEADPKKNINEKLMKTVKCNVAIGIYNETALSSISIESDIIHLVYVQNSKKSYSKEQWYLIGEDRHGTQIRSYLKDIEQDNCFFHQLYCKLHRESSGIKIEPMSICSNLNKDKLLKNLILSGFNRFISESLKLHNVVYLYNLAHTYNLEITKSCQDYLNYFSAFFNCRYHDTNELSSLTTNVDPIDNLIFEIWDNFKKIGNIDYYYVCGINSPIYLLHLSKGQHKKEFKILTAYNKAYASRENEINSTIIEILGRI